nr:putative nuclease HARBI1 [Nothobranchius furzeri]
MVGVPQSRPWCFCSGWQVEHPTGWSQEYLGCLAQLSTTSSIESRRMWSQSSTRSFTSPKPQRRWRLCLVGLLGWLDRAFMKAAGVIDGCHIRIKAPSGPDGQCYRNRKLFPSIILQAVCDHQGRFIDTYVGWPGSVHDSRVLRHSPLYRQSAFPPPGHFILADGGYPCLQHPLPLITPYKRVVQGVVAQRFNSHHSRARCIIEHAFGMKTRFRTIFLKALEVHHTFVPHVITACNILHNICLSAGDIVVQDDELEDDAPEDEGEAVLEAVSGALWRDQLSAEVSALEEVSPDHNYC